MAINFNIGKYNAHAELSQFRDNERAKIIRGKENDLKTNFKAADDYLAALSSYIEDVIIPAINNTDNEIINLNTKLVTVNEYLDYLNDNKLDKDGFDNLISNLNYTWESEKSDDYPTQVPTLIKQENGRVDVSSTLLGEMYVNGSYRVYNVYDAKNLPISGATLQTWIKALNSYTRALINYKADALNFTNDKTNQRYWRLSLCHKDSDYSYTVLSEVYLKDIFTYLNPIDSDTISAKYTVPESNIDDKTKATLSFDVKDNSITASKLADDIELFDISLLDFQAYKAGSTSLGLQILYNDKVKQNILFCLYSYVSTVGQSAIIDEKIVNRLSANNNKTYDFTRKLDNVTYANNYLLQKDVDVNSSNYSICFPGFTPFSWLRDKSKYTIDDNFILKLQVGDYISYMNNVTNWNNNPTYIDLFSIDLKEGLKIGQNGGIVPLDENGIIPETYLPSYVDSVIEGYYHNGAFYYDEEFTELITPESNKIYTDLIELKIYRWSGSVYSVISETLSLGFTENTAFSGKDGKDLQDKVKATENKNAELSYTENTVIGKVNNIDIVIKELPQLIKNKHYEIDSHTEEDDLEYNPTNDSSTVLTSLKTDNNGHVKSVTTGTLSGGGLYTVYTSDIITTSINNTGSILQNTHKIPYVLNAYAIDGSGWKVGLDIKIEFVNDKTTNIYWRSDTNLTNNDNIRIVIIGLK